MSQKKYVSLNKLSTFLDNLKNIFATQTTVEELSTNVVYINTEDNENVENPDIAMSDIIVDSTLSTTSTNPVQNRVITAEINSLSTAIADKPNKTGMTLGVHSDGYVYIFIDGKPQGNGLEITANVIEGDVFGYVDENKNIVLSGNLADGTYTAKYEMADGSVVTIGNLTIGGVSYYSITTNLTNCYFEGGTGGTTIAHGASYSAGFSANDGYEFSTITVTMGGTDITSNAVSGDNSTIDINITNVTGNIVISLGATVSSGGTDTPMYTNLAVPTDATGQTAWETGGWCNDSYMAGSSYAYRAATDGKITTNKFAVSHNDIIYVKGITYTDSTFPQIAVFDANGTYLNHGYASLMQTSKGCIRDLTATVGNDYWYFTNAGSGYSDVGTRFIRLAGMPSGSVSDIIITRNEPIA